MKEPVEWESLAVVADQVGCPTSTLGLAAACGALIERRLSGVRRFVFFAAPAATVKPDRV